MARERDLVPASLKWRLEDIFETVEDWNKRYDEVSGKLDFSKYEGKLSDPDTLFECLEAINAVMIDVSHLAVYAFMKHDEDTRKSETMALMSRMDMLEMKLMGNIAFVNPELSSLSVEVLNSLIADPKFKDYDYTLKKIIKNKPHVLSKEIEELLSQESRIFDGFRSIFSMIDNADFPHIEIKVDGEKVKLSHGMYGVLLHHNDRRVRKNAFKAYYQAYIDRINTITAAYVGNVDKNVFLAKARKYNSCLEKALEGEDVDVKVYENLLKSVNKNLIHDAFLCPVGS